MKRALVLGALVGSLAVSLSGCGSGQSSGLSAKGADALKPYVEDLRNAASGTSATTLQNEVHRFQAEVDKERAKGRISSDRAAELDSAATQLFNDFGQQIAPSPSTSSTISTPPSTTAPPSTPTTPPPTTPATPTTPTTPASPTMTTTVTVGPPSPPGKGSSGPPAP